MELRHRCLRHHLSPFHSWGGQPRNGFHKMHAESLKNDRNVGSNTMLERPAFPRVNVRILEATVLG